MTSVFSGGERVEFKQCGGSSIFELSGSAAYEYGMGNDGEKSLRMLRREGARIIAQDEATSVVWGMPGSAVATGCVDKVAALMDIPSVVGRMLGRG